MKHATFSFETIGNVVVIYDEDHGGRSVTNDIDFVIKMVELTTPDLNSKRVIYRDSRGVFDGINLDSKNNFLGFYSINERILKKALKKVFGN